MEESASLNGGTAASLVQEAVGGQQAPDDAIKQVCPQGFNEKFLLLCVLVASLKNSGCEKIQAKIEWRQEFC